MYCKTVSFLLRSQPVSVTSYLLQIGCESPDIIFSVKTYTRQQFTNLKSTSFSSLLQTKPAVIMMRFSPVNAVVFHSYNWRICQSHPQHCWYKLLKFNKLPRTEFVCVKTNLSTVLFKHSVTVTYIYIYIYIYRSRDSDHILQPHFLTDSILVQYSNTTRTYCQYCYRLWCISQPSIVNSQYETSAIWNVT